MPRARVSLVVTMVGFGLALSGWLPALPAYAVPSTCDGSAQDAVPPVVGDVNGDGRGDIAVGVPADANATGQPSGSVHLYLSDGGQQRVRPRSIGETVPGEAGFGTSAALVDLDHDHCADLVVGAPGAGTVFLARGSVGGVTPVRVQELDSPGADGDGFGTTVAASIRSAGGTTDLWVGAPLASVDGHAAAGRVYHYAVSPSGEPTLVSSVTFDDLTGGLAAGDHFGEVLAGLADGVAVGVPRRAVNGHAAAGVLVALHQTSGTLTSQVLSQDSPAVVGAAEAGDQFGAAVASGPFGATVLVGAPGEDVGRVVDAGSAQIFVTADGALVPTVGLWQGEHEIPGSPERGDRFGAAVAVGRATSCSETTGYAVGAPGEDIGKVKDAGAVSVYTPDQDIPCAAQNFRQGAMLPGKAEAGDEVGEALSTRRGADDQDEDIADQLLIGVPGEDLDSGVVQQVGRGVRPEYTAVGGVEEGARFGSVLASDAVGPSF